jgi:long-subunit fatty acid transport protein
MEKKLVFTAALAGLTLGAGTCYADASKIVSNPAELATITRPELTVVGLYVDTIEKFTGSVSRPFLTSTINLNGSAKANNHMFLPQGYFATPIGTTTKLVGGIGVGMPYDLNGNTVFPADTVWQFEYNELSYLLADITPGLAWQITDMIAVGLALDFDYLRGRYAVQRPLFFQSANGSFPDGLSVNDSDGWGFGAHAGILFTPVKSTRIRLNYRSSVFMPQSGNSRFAATFPTPATYASNRYHFHLTLPGQLDFKLTQFLSPNWFGEIGAVWTNWQRVHTINLYDVASPLGPVTSPQNFFWHDNIVYTVGAGYLASEFKWGAQLTAGVDTNFRKNSHEMPLAKVEAFTKIGKNFTIGGLYVHYFIKNYTPFPLGVDSINGTWSPERDLFGIKMTYAFG